MFTSYPLITTLAQDKTQGPTIQAYIDEIERSKEVTGGFYPHRANRVFSLVLADWGSSHLWTDPSHHNKLKLLQFTISFNRLVGSRLRK
jgi:hypothetical protein